MPPTLFPVCLGFASSTHNLEVLIVCIDSQVKNYHLNLFCFSWVTCSFKLGKEACNEACNAFLDPHRRPHGIKPCNISRWGQLHGCMCLHTQYPKIPKLAIRLAQLTAVLAAANYRVTGKTVQSLQGVCKCVFCHKQRSLKKMLHACVCLRVYVSL